MDMSPFDQRLAEQEGEPRMTPEALVTELVSGTATCEELGDQAFAFFEASLSCLFAHAILLQAWCSPVHLLCPQTITLIGILATKLSVACEACRESYTTTSPCLCGVFSSDPFRSPSSPRRSLHPADSKASVGGAAGARKRPDCRRRNRPPSAGDVCIGLATRRAATGRARSTTGGSAARAQACDGRLRREASDLGRRCCG